MNAPRNRTRIHRRHPVSRPTRMSFFWSCGGPPPIDAGSIGALHDLGDRRTRHSPRGQVSCTPDYGIVSVDGQPRAGRSTSRRAGPRRAAGLPGAPSRPTPRHLVEARGRGRDPLDKELAVSEFAGWSGGGGSRPGRGRGRGRSDEWASMRAGGGVPGAWGRGRLVGEERAPRSDTSVPGRSPLDARPVVRRGDSVGA